MSDFLHQQALAMKDAEIERLKIRLEELEQKRRDAVGRLIERDQELAKAKSIIWHIAVLIPKENFIDPPRFAWEKPEEKV